MSIIEGFEHIVRENEPLAPYTRFKLGGNAQYFAEPTNRDELIKLVNRFTENEQPIRLIGAGANLLVRDEGVQGLVIHLSSPEFGEVAVDGNRITAGGGAKLSHFVATAVREGFAGPEQLVGLPGTIGGALHENTGTNSVDIGTWVQSAEVLTRSGEIKTHEKSDMTFSYRESSLSELVILKATFEFEKASVEALTKEMQKLWIVRRATHPRLDEHAGYMFKDIGGETASDLLTQAGLKGAKIGNVSALDSDPNVFVVEQGGTTAEVLELVEKFKDEVKSRLELDLDLAIEIW